jgi:hypothetical protein
MGYLHSTPGLTLSTFEKTEIEGVIIRFRAAQQFKRRRAAAALWTWPGTLAVRDKDIGNTFLNCLFSKDPKIGFHSACFDVLRRGKRLLCRIVISERCRQQLDCECLLIGATCASVMTRVQGD